MYSVTGCKYAECDSEVFSRERCRKHYNRDYHAGDLKPLTLAEKFWRKVHKTDSCWNWTGPLRNGYGRHNQTHAHRVAYELAKGKIPSGMHVDHMCHNRKCVNPEHLRVVKPKENSENRTPSITGPSGVRGVSWCKVRKKWIVHVTHNYKTRYFGGFDRIEDAEQAAIAVRNQLFTHNDEDRRCG